MARLRSSITCASSAPSRARNSFSVVSACSRSCEEGLLRKTAGKFEPGGIAQECPGYGKRRSDRACGDAILLRGLPERGHIGLAVAQLVQTEAGAAGRRSQLHANVDVPAADVLLDGRSHRCFERIQFGPDVEMQVEPAMIYGS